MQARDFAFWLQGFFELAPPGPLTEKQADTIRRHLAMVFVHEIDPQMGDAAHQAKLNEAHAPRPPAVPPHESKPASPPYFVGGSSHPGEVFMRC